MCRLTSLLVAFAVLIGLAPSNIDSVAAQSSTSAKTINLELIVDESGSMAAETDTGVPRIESAKTVLTEVISAIPDVDGVNVGLRVYGHQGDNTDEGKAESCNSTELLVPMDGVDTQSLNENVDALRPVGWTPIGLSLEEAGKDFDQPASDEVINAIVVVTDGLETCDTDPAAIAGDLRASEAGIITNVIGFGTTPEELDILEGIASEGDGQLLGSNNAGQLMSALFEVLEELEVVEETGSGETRDSPLGIGRIGTVGDYEVSVIDVIPNADDVIAAENPYNESPESGNQYFMVRIAVTYVGSTSGQPSFELNPQAVGKSSVSYTSFDFGCGVISDDLLLANEMFEGGSAEVNVCWQIASEDEDSLVMYVEVSTDYNADPVWFSLGNPIEVPVDPEATPTEESSVERDKPKADNEDSENDSNQVESSRKNSVDLGTEAQVGDYEVSVIDVIPNADDVVAAENPYNESPEAGNQFFIVRIEVTYVSSTSGQPSFELNPQAVGDSSVSYTTFDFGCGVVTDDLLLANEMFEDGSAEFNVCWQIASEDEDSLVMYIEDFTDYNADPVWFALQD